MTTQKRSSTLSKATFKANIIGTCLIIVSLLTGCTGIPEGIAPVTDFDKTRYLGKWYEIARLDHRFERGMEKITAEYSLNENGGIKVVNRGFIVDQKEWKSAEGKAYFVGDEKTGHLKVSFFGPFYGSYIVFELDKENYQYAFITSHKQDYLWFLSRTPEVDEALMQKFKTTAKTLGFNTEALIFVDHSH